MIITTKRPTHILLMDTIITAAAWIAFIYQFTAGVVYLLSERPGTHLLSFLGVPLNATASTLIVCLLVCLFNALVVYIWARLRSAPRTGAFCQSLSQDLTPDILADHFSLSRRQVDDIQDSRVTVVYHSATGGITHLETGDLHLQEVGRPLHGTALRVA